MVSGSLITTITYLVVGCCSKLLCYVVYHGEETVVDV